MGSTIRKRRMYEEFGPELYTKIDLLLSLVLSLVLNLSKVG